MCACARMGTPAEPMSARSMTEECASMHPQSRERESHSHSREYVAFLCAVQVGQAKALQQLAHLGVAAGKCS